MEILMRQKATRRFSSSHPVTAISMSALGQKRTSKRVKPMSALPPESGHRGNGGKGSFQFSCRKYLGNSTD
jgi:hypothetical protein